MLNTPINASRITVAIAPMGVRAITSIVAVAAAAVVVAVAAELALVEAANR